MAGLVHGPPAGALAALELVEHVRRRTRALPHVHETLGTFETGQGPLLQWANRVRGDDRRRPLVELLLRMVSGPFVPEGRFQGQVEPGVDGLSDWLEDVVRRLLAAPAFAGPLVGIVSPAPTGGAEAPSYSGGGRAISNWLSVGTFDREVAAHPLGNRTVDVLRQAEGQMGDQLIVLPSAVRSAEQWSLDCPPADLLRALLGLEAYAAALAAGLSREQCAKRYQDSTGVEMSQESAATWKLPTRRRQRLFVAGPHGEQYFDMHAKPGNLTRVHVWVSATAGVAAPTIYVGHCGRHLD